MDINQLIADLQEISQKNSISHYKRYRCADAATALSTLQAENEKLRADLNDLKAQRDMYSGDEGIASTFAELEQVKRERDAAVADLKKWKICATCKNYQPHGKSTNCKIKSAYLPGGNWAGCSKWEWRGQKDG